MVDRLAQVGGSGFPHLSDNKSSNLGWRVVLALRSDPSVAIRVGNDLEGNIVQVLLDFSVLELSTDQTAQDEAIACEFFMIRYTIPGRRGWMYLPLGSEQGVFRIDHSLTLSRLTNQSLAILGKGDHRWCRTTTLSILDDTGSLSFHDRHT